MRVEGILFCPQCFDRRVFVPTPDAAVGDRYPPIECIECGYEFSKVVQENPAGGVKHVQVIPDALRDRARQEYAEEFAHHVARAGWRLSPAHKAVLAKKTNRG